MRGLYAIPATCLALAACGGEQSEPAEVASAYNDVVEAVRDKDYEAACDGLTERTRQDLSRAAEIQRTDGCAPTLQRLIADVGVDQQAVTSVADTDVEVAGETAATVGDVRMAKEDGEWRVEGDLDFVRPFLSGPPRRQ